MTCPHFPYSLSGFYLLYIPVICFYSLVVAAGHSSSSAVILEYFHLISKNGNYGAIFGVAIASFL